MNAPQKTESSSPTPDQLLRLLDLQLESERSKRKTQPRHRALILVGGLVGIAAAAGVALVVAQQMLLESRAQGEVPRVEAARGK